MPLTTEYRDDQGRNLVDELDPHERASWWAHQLLDDVKVLTTCVDDRMMHASPRELTTLVKDVRATQVAIVKWLRSEGASWATIAEAMGQPTSTLHDRYHGTLNIE